MKTKEIWIKRSVLGSMAALAVMAVVGCAEEVSELFTGNATKVEIAATVGPTQSSALTRGADGLDGTSGFSLLWSTNNSSKVKIWADNGSGSFSEYSYKVTGATALTAESTTPTFPAGVTSVSVYGWYPYTASNSFTIQSNQQTDDNYCLSDLMLAQPATCTRVLNTGAVTPAALNFQHVMSKVKIVVSPASGITITGISLGNVKPSTTITYNGSANPKLSAGEASGSVGTVTLLSGGSITSSNTAAQRTFCGVFPAQSISGNFITINATSGGGSGTITYSLPSAKAFASGNEYTANIEISASQIGQTVSLADWTGADGTVNISAGGDAPTLSEESLTLTFRSGTGSVTASMTGASSFGAVSDATGKATVSASGATITVTPVAAGSANISVFPTNKSGVFSSAVLPVTINALGLQTSDDSGNGYTTFSTIATQNYTGSAVTPEPTVTVKGSDGNKTLTKNTDFTFSYSNNTDEGNNTATVTVTGKGNYSGTASATFSILAVNTTLAAVKASWDSKYLGCYVDASGNVTSVSNANTIGRIAYYNADGVETSSSASGKTILVLAVSNVGSYTWKNASSAGESAYNNTSTRNGLAFCETHDDSTVYPAAYNAYHWSTEKPTGSTSWFLPSRGQWDAMLAVVKMNGTGKISSGVYWSSTEHSSTAYYAWRYGFNTSNWGTTAKTTSNTVRACFAY